MKEIRKTCFIIIVCSKQQTVKKKETTMTHNDVWNAIDKFASSKKMSCSGLARFSGLDPTTFNKSKRSSKYGQPRWPSTNSIAKILDATNSNIDEFLRCFYQQ